LLVLGFMLLFYFGGSALLSDGCTEKFYEVGWLMLQMQDNREGGSNPGRQQVLQE